MIPITTCTGPKIISRLGVGRGEERGAILLGKSTDIRIIYITLLHCISEIAPKQGFVKNLAYQLEPHQKIAIYYS